MPNRPINPPKLYQENAFQFTAKIVLREATSDFRITLFLCRKGRSANRRYNGHARHDDVPLPHVVHGITFYHNTSEGSRRTVIQVKLNVAVFQVKPTQVRGGK
jgi:hypothetical protein